MGRMGRTVQCQNCGDWGHNRRGCPVTKKAHARVESLAVKYGIERSEDERAYASTSWINRINDAAVAAGNLEDEVDWRERWLWEELEDRKMAQARKSKRGRRCGFCGEHGHNSRSCQSKKQHRKDADAMQGLAHRVVAACLQDAGIVPGALMRVQEYDYRKGDYEQLLCVVTGINWELIGEPDYDTPQGLPRSFDDWFKNHLINVHKPNGETWQLPLPQNIKQQANYRYHPEEPVRHGLMSGVVGGSVNKSNGWKGDNVTLLSPDAFGIYHRGTRKPEGSEGIRLAAGGELEEEVNRLINQVSGWSEH